MSFLEMTGIMLSFRSLRFFIKLMAMDECGIDYHKGARVSYSFYLEPTGLVNKWNTVSAQFKPERPGRMDKFGYGLSIKITVSLGLRYSKASTLYMQQVSALGAG